MITEARIDNLLRCVRNTESAHGFDLRGYTFQHPCGSYGCLIGNDRIALGCEGWGAGMWSMHEYGISTHGLWGFLFTSCGRLHDDKPAAIRRLRKFIYYVLHKRELLYDDSGRIRETARRSEGNHMVLRSVKSAVERKERELTAV